MQNILSFEKGRDDIRDKLKVYDGKLTDFAKSAGVSRSYLYHFLAGGDIRVSTLQKIANALQADAA